MKLEQPKINPTGKLSERVAYLEAYIYRLHGELTAALNALEKLKEGKNHADLR